MNSNTTSPSRTLILAALDATRASEDVVRTSAALACTLPGSELHVVHVVPAVVDVDAHGAVASSAHELVENARTLTEGAREQVAQTFSGRIVQHLAFGTPAREILQLATDLRADLVVVGSHRRNRVERWILGSVAERVSRQASCSVLVARSTNYEVAVPEIEPPCPACVAVQKESHGDRLWCNQHQRKYSGPHLHYEIPKAFTVGSSLIRTED